jgi:hypothetical protein
LPLITSKEGLNGLECAERTLSQSGFLAEQDSPGQTNNLLEFIVNNAMSPARYVEWVAAVNGARARCVAQQTLDQEFCNVAATR